RLFGIRPRGLRVLEIGCGSGGHILSVAASSPGFTCVGIDPSEGEIARARALAEAAELENVTLHATTEIEGEFDFVITHGVLSWVSEAARSAIFATARRCLAPGGVFYASYNVHPGWFLRGAMREAMRWRAGTSVPDARKLLETLESRVERGTAWRAAIDEEVARLRVADDAYVFHEHLETENHPRWFHEVASEARSHGLHFVSEAEPGAILHPQASPRALASLREIAEDVEQAFDLVRGRSFRCSIFSMSKPKPCAPDPELVAFARDAGELALEPEHASAIASLAAVFPDGKPISTLSIDPTSILPLHVAGIVELRSRTLGLAGPGDPHPTVTSLARAQALRPGPVANLRGEPIPLSEEERQALVFLDGARPETRERLRRLAFLRAS
ncbi:MAG: methyltransferase domain-containing protein, partial [Polyangiales bacterium]